jgi:hypothetical protein
VPEVGAGACTVNENDVNCGLRIGDCGLIAHRAVCDFTHGRAL